MNHSRRTFLRLAIAGGSAWMLCACQKRNAAAPGLPPDVEYYTCSMHPFVRAKAPGKCPVCGMDLIPVMKRGAESASATVAAEVAIPPERLQEIGVTYATVERRTLRRSLRAAGTVEYDRQRYWEFVARTDGYVKKLFVTSPGESVESNQPLLSLYSPDLFTAEREYVMLLQSHDANLLASARARLNQWNVTDDQVAELERSRTPAEEVTLRSPFRGVVKEVTVEQGGNVKAGDRLVAVADLSQIWVWADIYELELGSLREGQDATVTAGAFPGQSFAGKVSLIDPFLDEGKRTFKVRIDIPNPELKLRPGMYVDVALDIEMGTGLVIPLNAVMPTGTRNFVFVDKGGGRLEPRDVKLGDEFDGCYEVKAGLAEGERIAASAIFLIDAEAQIQGALSGFGTGGPQ